MNNLVFRKLALLNPLILLLFLLITARGSYSQYLSKRKYKSEFVTEEAKENYLKTLKEKIENYFATPYKIDVKKWDKLFYELSVDLIRSPKIEKALNFVINKIDSIDERLTVRAILTARALYPLKFKGEMASLFSKTKRYQTALYAFLYLYFADSSNYRNRFSQLQKRFGSEKLQTKLTEKLILRTPKFFNQKELEKIFSLEFLKGHLVIFTILRHNRKIPGLTIIRKSNGEFLMQKDSLWGIPQLAYSVTDFPYYLLDGNTPQGLFSFEGFYRSDKKSIGPTPIPIIRLPFESNAKKYFKNGIDSVMNYETYSKMFPKAIRNYDAIYESFYAGKLGRKLLVMHGSTDNPLLYKDEPYFPLTPSTGCITSYEKWDEKSGKLIESDQLKLVNAILSTGSKKGFLFVFELDDKNSKITKKEIEGIINNLK